MTVDGQDVKEFGVQQWNLEHEYSQLSNESQWPDGATNPLILPSTTGFKKVKVTVMIRGSDRKEIWEKAGMFIARLLTPREYSFDGFEGRYFFGYLKNASQAETCLQKWHKATLELTGYEYGEQTQVESTKKCDHTDKHGDIINTGSCEDNTSHKFNRYHIDGTNEKHDNRGRKKHHSKEPDKWESGHN